MSLLSRCNRAVFALLLACALLFGVLPAVGAGEPVSRGGELRAAAETFLSELPVSPGAREQLLDAVGKGGLSSVIVREGAYSLALIPIPADEEPDFVAAVEQAGINQALLQARNALALALDAGGPDRGRYRHKDALASALLSYYARYAREGKLRGVETAAAVIEAGKGRFAAALAWLSPESAKALSKAAPTAEAVNDGYCRFLYLNQAKGLFDGKDYAGALPLFKEIHDLRWMDIDAYLDAAECFLRTGEPKECLKLLLELRAALDAEMSSGELERVGRLCREAGNRKAALEAFKAARVRYHEGR